MLINSKTVKLPIKIFTFFSFQVQLSLDVKQCFDIMLASPPIKYGKQGIYKDGH